MFSKDMLVYNSAVFAVTQTNVFLLFGSLFAFSFLITCDLIPVVWFPEEGSRAASQEQNFHRRLFIKVTSVEQTLVLWLFGVKLEREGFVLFGGGWGCQ